MTTKKVDIVKGAAGKWTGLDSNLAFDVAYFLTISPHPTSQPMSSVDYTKSLPVIAQPDVLVPPYDIAYRTLLPQGKAHLVPALRGKLGTTGGNDPRTSEIRL